MSADYPPTIDLTPTSEGVFIPDFDSRPRAPIQPYYAPPDPSTLNQLPEPAPRYDSGSAGLSDSDIADFGTDAYGRSVVQRNPVTGKAEFNPEIDYGGPSFETDPQQRRRANRALDDLPDARRVRRGVGGAFRRVTSALPVVDDAVGLADFVLNEPGSNTGNRWVDGFINLPLDLVRGDPIFAPQPSAPTGTISRPTGEIPVGQCLANYRYVWIYRHIDQNGTVRKAGTPGQPIFDPFQSPRPGPLSYPQPHSDYGGTKSATRNLYVTVDSTGFQNGLGSLPPGRFEVNEWYVKRADGLADDCGIPAVEEEPTAPPATPTIDYPPPNTGYPERDRPPTYDPPPDVDIDPPPDIDVPDIPDIPEIDRPPQNDIDPPPDPPEENEDGPPTQNNNECCPATTLKLDEILRRLEGEGKGTLDIEPCDYEEAVIPAGQSGLAQTEPEPTAVDYGGFGLSGIYSAIAAIEKSLNFIASNTKCPPEINAALPMHWEAKVGEIPQLSVIWRKTSGGGSAWSMSIPHPREDIDKDYPFAFPLYTKGSNMATARLKDNSKIIINAVSKGEAEQVIGYIETLIDSAFIPEEGLRIVHSSGVADYQEVEVRASYLKKFAGHKNTTPLWAISLD